MPVEVVGVQTAHHFQQALVVLEVEALVVVPVREQQEQ